MNSKTLFKNIFGKENGITKLDIEEKIIGCFKENAFFECKRIDEIVSKVSKQRIDPRDLIMPSLVAFLNKIDSGGGILALGIYAKDKMPTEILGVDESSIKSEGSLKDWIINDISSIPQALECQGIEVETINLSKSKNIFLIEIHPQDTNVVYYCTRDNCAYKREADETKKISLAETFVLVEEKRIAKVFVDLEGDKLKEEEGIVQYNIKVVYNNFGAKPAFHTSASFLFKTSDTNNCAITYSASRIQDITDLNVCFRCYQKSFTEPIYPNRPMVSGKINLKFKESAIITLLIEVDEEKGRSKQEFLISKDGIKVAGKNFKSYI